MWRRRRTVYIKETNKTGDTSYNRSINFEETSVRELGGKEGTRWDAADAQHTMSLTDLVSRDSSVRSQANGPMRYIREVVVERRHDDQFDVHIVQDGDGLVAVGPGFFPKDRLVSLNDRNLESMSAEKVNRIIRSLAGRTLTIEVLSVNNHEAPMERKQIKRFGTIRARQECKATKNIFWLVEPDKYNTVQLLDTNKDRARVRFFGRGGAVVEVSLERLEKANDAEFDMSDYLSTLQFINETSILHVLRTRAKGGYNCTFVGSAIMVVLNAEESKDNSLCADSPNTAIIKAFREIYRMRPDGLPPHNLSAAYNASRSALRGSSKQCIVVMGTRLSDKDVIVRDSLKYLALAHLRKVEPVDACHWVDDVCTLVDSCCGTMGKNNHDCTIIYKMDIDGRGYACQFTAEAMLVNRAKLFYRRIGPSRILCAISHCDRPAIVRQFMLDEIDINDNTFLHKTQDREECRHEWRRLIEAFERRGTLNVIVNFVCAMAAVILHLGSCDISKLSGISLEVARDTCWTFPQIDRCASILKIDKDVLLDIIFYKDAEMRDESEITPLRLICGFATACYNCLIEAVLFAVNQSMAGSGDEPRSTISVVCTSDISDFQQNPPSKPDPGANYAQLVSNYLNEKIHHMINECLFDNAQKDLQKEYPEYNFGLSQLYSFDPMRRLMEEAGVKLGQNGGLLRLLDNSFVSHEEVIRMIYAELWRSGDRTISVVNNPAIFCVYHFGGSLPVIYDPSDWYAVFKDLPISSRFIDIFDYSQRSFITSVRQCISCSEGDRTFPSHILRSSGRSVISGNCATADRIEFEMKYILSTIQSSQIHACYCMTDGVGFRNDEAMRKQLRAFSVVPNCQLYQKALTVKFSHRMFVDKYASLIPSVNVAELGSARQAVEDILGAVCVNSYAYKIVSSHVFMRHFLARELEFRLEEQIETELIKLQSLCRSYLARIRFKGMQLQHRALQCIQRNGRIFLKIRRWSWWKLLVSVKSVMPLINQEEKTQQLEEELTKLNKRMGAMQKEIDDLRSLNKDYEQRVAFYKRLAKDRRNSNDTINSSDTNKTDLEAKLQLAMKSISQKDNHIRFLTKQLNEGTAANNIESSTEDLQAAKKPCRGCQQLEAQNADLRGEIESLREATLLTAERVKELEKADQEHLLTLSDLKNSHADLEELKAKLEEENQRLQIEKEELTSQLQEAQASNSNQESHVDASTSNPSEIHRLKQQVKSLERNVNDLTEELNERNDQVQILEQACLKSDLQLQQERKMHIEELNQKDEEFEHFQSNYQSRLKLQQEKQDEEANENMRLRKQIRLLESNLNEAKLESQQSSCSDELVEAMKKKIVRYKALLSDARFQLDQATRSDEMDLLVKSLRSNVKDLEEENTSLERSRQVLKTERDEIQSEYDECQRQMTRLKQEMDTVVRDNRSLLERYEESERESDAIISQLQERTSALSACQMELNTCRANVERLRIENGRLQSKVKDLEANIEAHSDDTSSNVQYTECRINELENQLAVDELMKKRLQNQVDRLKEQIESHLTSLSECRGQLELAESQLKEAQADVRFARKECETLKAKLKESENQKQVLEETESARCKDVSNLRSQLRSAYERLNRLNDVLVGSDDIPSELLSSLSQSEEGSSSRND